MNHRHVTRDNAIAARSFVTRDYAIAARSFVTSDHMLVARSDVTGEPIARSYVTREHMLVDRKLVKAGRSVNEGTYHRSMDAAVREPAVNVRDVRNVIDRRAAPAATAPAPS
jgi:hypothetical protein